VGRHADGSVSHLRLEDGRDVAADFFIDCSGFVSLLLDKTLGVPWVDFGKWLPVDRAWAVPTERPEGGITPYTRSTALEAGWAWRIPLRDRCGHGHVFASRFIDEERAREQLLGQIDGRPLAEPRLIRFATGHRERFWAKNVVGLGLAAGFIEPLESTAIFLVHNAIGRLIPLLQQPGGPTAEMANAYSAQQVRQFQRIRDFIILHYCLTERRDSELWRHMASLELPESLAYKIHTWRETGVLVDYDDEGFDRTSWLAIFAGLGHWPHRVNPWMEEVPQAIALQYLRQRREAIGQMTDRMPEHEVMLQHLIAGLA
jgi:tryptophan halogenase